MLHSSQKYFINFHSLSVSSRLVLCLSLKKLSLYKRINKLPISIDHFPTRNQNLETRSCSISVWCCERLEIFRIIKNKGWLYQVRTSGFFIDIIKEIRPSYSVNLFHSKFSSLSAYFIVSCTKHIKVCVFEQ
jgi:hypothetical protein